MKVKRMARTTQRKTLDFHWVVFFSVARTWFVCAWKNNILKGVSQVPQSLQRGTRAKSILVLLCSLFLRKLLRTSQLPLSLQKLHPGCRVGSFNLIPWFLSCSHLVHRHLMRTTTRSSAHLGILPMETDVEVHNEVQTSLILTSYFDLAPVMETAVKQLNYLDIGKQVT